MITVKTQGFKELEAKLGIIKSKATRRNVGIRALTKAAEPMAAKARQLAPKDENDLENSIKVSPRASNKLGQATKRGGRGGQFGDVLEVFIGIDATQNPALNIYAAIQEEGKANNPAQPYMRPAYESNKMKSLDIIKDAILIEINNAVGRQERKAMK